MKLGLMAFSATILAVTVAGSATAAENPFAQDRAIVRLDGLDLASVDGQQRMAIRMDQAARAVCGERLAGVHLALEQRGRECRAEVMADIRTRIEGRMAMASDKARPQLALAR
ncbi:UrcA family protein [Novosphingobium resinovorum]|uniref:UrcA family protein n=1 Tax=Novosphingobium resinovorum TaxID=158500 RepID=UPI002ED26742|nr:UrcA family protein [Novosphingobium resinovorum]